MVIGRKIAVCKKHGETLHGIYQYNNYTPHLHCLECAKERKSKRHKDPNKRKHDIEFAKKYREEHREYFNTIGKRRSRLKRAKKLLEVSLFLKRERKNIEKILLIVVSNLSFSDIKSYCVRYNITSIEGVKKHIISFKKNDLLNAEKWGQSSLLKYHKGMRENWGDINEVQKEVIRKQYKEKSIRIVNQKIQELMTQTISPVDVFKQEKQNIIEYLAKTKSDLGIRAVKNYCLKHNLLSLEQIKRYILSKNKTYQREVTKQGMILKYKMGLLKTYSLLPEEKKKEIREEYKKMAREIIEN